MAHFARGFLAAAFACQFVVAPESAIDQNQIAAEAARLCQSVSRPGREGATKILLPDCSRVKPMWTPSGAGCARRSSLT